MFMHCWVLCILISPSCLSGDFTHLAHDCPHASFFGLRFFIDNYLFASFTTVSAFLCCLFLAPPLSHSFPALCYLFPFGACMQEVWELWRKSKFLRAPSYQGKMEAYPFGGDRWASSNFLFFKYPLSCGKPNS